VLDTTIMYTVEEPNTIIEQLKDYFEEQECKVEESNTTYKLKGTFPFPENIVLTVSIKKVTECVRCVKLRRVFGGKMEFLDTFNEIKLYLTELSIIL